MTESISYAPWVAMYGMPHPYGKCQCGCGSDTTISTTTNLKVGRSKGKPNRFCHGHNSIVSPVDRFLENVKAVESGCWEWQAGKTPAGYGLIGIREKLVYTHRYSYELHNGPIPKGFHVCHKCDNPPCCNPDHLFLGTDADNLHDMHSKGRGYIPAPRKGTENINAKLTDADVHQIRNRRANGETGTSLAKEFGVTDSCISSIVTKQSWTHVG